MSFKAKRARPIVRASGRRARRTVLRINQYDAFWETSLDGILRSLDVRQVAVTGVLARSCCEMTARSAFVRACGVFFVVDGTAASNEALRRAGVKSLSHGFAVPVLTDEVLDAFRG